MTPATTRDIAIARAASAANTSHVVTCLATTAALRRQKVIVLFQPLGISFVKAFLEHADSSIHQAELQVEWLLA